VQAVLAEKDLMSPKVVMLVSHLLDSRRMSNLTSFEGFLLNPFLRVGKSTFMGKITKTKSVVAAYAFTTLTAIPGVLEYGGAEIQILDLPGIIEGAAEGKGRGRQVISAAKVSSCICVAFGVLSDFS
jgi:ribosome-interacting GTPase 1